MQFLVAAAVLILTCSVATAELPVPIQQMLDWAYPHKTAPQSPPVAAPEPIPAPKPVPPVAKPPPPVKIAPVKPAGRKPTPSKPKARTNSDKSPGDGGCGDMRYYAAKHGSAFVIREAKRRGYSDWQISMGRSMCGV